MKKILIPILMAVSVLAAAQDKTVTDSSRGFVLRFREFLFQQLPGPLYRFNLKSPGGNVYIASKKQGIEVYAPKIDLDAIAVLSKEVNTIKTATASGGVRAVRSAPDGRSDFKGGTAKYTMQGARATLAISGPVRMTNFSSANQRSFDATGSSLMAEMDKGGSMTTAILNGPVTLKIKQAANGKNKASDLTVTAQKMVLAQRKSGGTLTLTGNVRPSGLLGGLTFEGSSSRIVMTLNMFYEVVKVDID